MLKALMKRRRPRWIHPSIPPEALQREIAEFRRAALLQALEAHAMT